MLTLSITVRRCLVPGWVCKPEVTGSIPVRSITEPAGGSGFLFHWHDPRHCERGKARLPPTGEVESETVRAACRDNPPVRGEQPPGAMSSANPPVRRGAEVTRL